MSEGSVRLDPEDILFPNVKNAEWFQSVSGTL